MILHPTQLRLAAFAGATLISLWTSAALAQDADRGWTVTIGGGAQTYPRYPGSDDYGLNVLPIFGLRRAGTPMPFVAQDDGIGFGILGRDSIVNFGPALNLVNRRRERDVGAPVGNVGYTVEAGGFVEVFPVPNFRIRGEIRQGIGGHQGLVGDVGADLVLRDRDGYIFSIGPRARWGDSDYHNAYFGVTPAVAAVTGLPAYPGRSGFYAIGGTSTLTVRLGRNWGLHGYARYDRLIRNAADSPIVRAFGSRDQFAGGGGLFLEFNVR
jgi:outer membrane scaffolding protein for murein synthesis (MipA/OmpV family)